MVERPHARLPPLTSPVTSPAPPAAPTPPALTWSWPDALFGALVAVPAAVVAAGDVPRGLAFAVGVLPAAAMGVLPAHRRPLTFVVGALAGASMFLGAVLAGIPVLAVIAVFSLSIGAVLLTRQTRAGQVLLVLALPLVAVGLSYDDLGQAAGLALILVGGAGWATVVSLLWPKGRQPGRPRPASAAPPTLAYGIRLGSAAALAAALGFALDLDHVGWACAATLFVMRPSMEAQRLRSAGRVVSVAVGGTAAILLVTTETAPAWYAAAVVAVLAATAGTHRSRWYVTATFSTFLVLSLLLYANPDQAGARWTERLGETTFGVGLAYLFGIVVPAANRRLRH